MYLFVSDGLAMLETASYSYLSANESSELKFGCDLLVPACYFFYPIAAPEPVLHSLPLSLILLKDVEVRAQEGFKLQGFS